MTTQMEFYIFRHGETDWNQSHRFQGHTDIPLNQNGINQALELSLFIQKINPEIILSSDLSRALLTAQIINQHLQLKVMETPALRECRLGEPEGLLRSEIETKYGPDSWKKWLSIDKQDLDFSFPEGESKREHLIRQLNYLENFAFQNTSLKKIAVSTHGGSLRRIIHHCLNSPPNPIPIPNCALYKIIFKLSDKSWHYEGPIYLSNLANSITTGLFE